MLDVNFNNYNWYLKPGATDMRKRGSSLAILVEAEMKLNPFEKSIFVFCNNNRKIIKALVWDSNGFWELSKKLESGTFRWPNSSEQAMNVNWEAILWMLKGGDPWRSLPKLQPKKVC